jgi:two-component system, OmpR family, response regulator
MRVTSGAEKQPIPIVDAENIRYTPGTVSFHETMDKPRILVVDDDGPILTLMRAILREFGFEPIVAGTGAQALDLARTNPPDLVLLDIRMPGMSGAEVIRALREDGAQVPILILSGEPVSVAEVARLGANGAVQKPFDVPELIETIRGYVGVTR